MKALSYPHWKGFELVPQGCLLEQLIDLSGNLGIAYERCVEFYKDFHTHDRLMLVFPRGASSMEIRTQGARQTFHIDNRSFLIVPANTVHDDEGTSSIYDTFALYPDNLLFKEIFDDLGLKNAGDLHSSCKKLKRSQWLEQVLQEYFYERVIAKKTRGHVQLLEHEIVREVLKLCCGITNTTRNELADGADTATKAVRYVEANLFAMLTNQTIAKKIGASESDLLRKFRKATKTTPYSYIKNRRLEEAKELLETSTHPIGEIALLVGYRNFGAFTDAFRSKFGHPPLHWRNTFSTLQG